MLPSPGSVFVSNTRDIESFEHIVFLGVHNAETFVSELSDWLPKLQFGDSALVIADNASTDNTLEMLSNLAQKMRNPFAVLRNSRNYGGYGNLAVNLELFQGAKWVTTLHQDDTYSASHLAGHTKILVDAPENLGMLASEAMSVNTQGKTVPYPRASWLLAQDADPVTIFLAHLKQHVFPFSGATFSKQALLDFPIPWHSTAFPDTELIMKMVADYRILLAPGVTVKYLENPHSESHSINHKQRDLGAFQALIRTFAHPNFAKICKAVGPQEQGRFLTALKEGIEVRIHDPQIRALLVHTGLEMSAEHFGMSPQVADMLGPIYLQAEDFRAAEVLTNLSSNKGRKILHDVQGLLPMPQIENGSRRFLLYLLRLFPLRLRVRIIRSLMASSTGKRAFSSWNFDWKNR